MTTSIAIILVALATIGNTTSIFFIERKLRKLNAGFLSDRPLHEHTSYETKNRINELENKVKEAQPIVDKYKKEQKQKHWKQYNDWKYYVEDNYVDDEMHICSQCHSDNLEINTEYEYDHTRRTVFIEDRVDYPKSAKYKCNTCGEVISKWEFKEDNGC
ncbi:hypothetical protein [Staphylococcus ureilyticus]|nr:hypothetical protein [Staphylococcus ureilyticus]